MSTRGGRGGKALKVLNKAPAPVQITAEQLLREANDRRDKPTTKPRQNITDPEELDEYRFTKRKQFEDSLRMSRGLITVWIRYAQWEETQKEIERARSVYERAIDVDYQNVNLWLKYAEMEMRHKNIAHARNIWDRAVTLLPRVSQFWYKYIYMEEMLENVAAARQIYQRWMEWHPAIGAFSAFVNFEQRHGELQRCQQIFQRLVEVHPEVQSWLKWAKFHERAHDIGAARNVFELAVEKLGDDANNEKFFLEFAKFEERNKEDERCRAIYKYALDHVPKHLAGDLYQEFINFEKQHGERSGIETVILSKRRFQYEAEVKADPANYDSWFDYIRLEEEAGSEAKVVREVYERAVAHKPPAADKRFWRRYIYLWLKYALFEELTTKDFARARQVYKTAVEIVPHKKFSFAKLWIMYAHFEVRQRNVAAARKVFGAALGLAPNKEKICLAYVALETQLGEIGRCRTLHSRLLELAPTRVSSWLRFAALEQRLGEYERARSLLELCVTRPSLDMPEVAWKAYIDLELDLAEYDRARALYERLLAKTQHVKVWLSFASFEASVSEIARARALLEKAFALFKGPNTHAERYLVFEQWKAFEVEVGDADALEALRKNVPRKIKKLRKIATVDGSDAGSEEYFDYVFPDEQAAAPHLRLLEVARKWKLAQAQQNAAKAVEEANAVATASLKRAAPTDGGDDDDDDVDDD